MRIETRTYSSPCSWTFGTFYTAVRFVTDAMTENQSKNPRYVVVPAGRLGPVARVEKGVSGVIIGLLTTYPHLHENLVQQVKRQFTTVPIFTTVTFNAELHVVGVKRSQSTSKEASTQGGMVAFCAQHGMVCASSLNATRVQTFGYLTLLHLAKATTNLDKVITYIGDNPPGYINRTFLLGPLFLALGPHLEGILDTKDNKLFSHLLWVSIHEHLPELAKELRKQMATTGLRLGISPGRLATLYWSNQ